MVGFRVRCEEVLWGDVRMVNEGRGAVRECGEVLWRGVRMVNESEGAVRECGGRILMVERWKECKNGGRLKVEEQHRNL